MSGAVEVHQGAGLQLSAEQEIFSERQIATLEHLGMKRASRGDLTVFMHVCQRTGLDPFARQIYMIERQGKQTIQTGIDGFRLVARRAVLASGETLSISGGEWCDAEGRWSDVWLGEGPPSAARVVIRRDGQPYVGIALWREYAQYTREGRLTSMWDTRSAGQLAKCAEALGLRRAFPMDLSGVYTDDEMAREQVRRPRSGGLGAALREPTAQQGSGPGQDEATLRAESEAGPDPVDLGDAPEAPPADEAVDAEVIGEEPEPSPEPTATPDEKPISAAQRRTLMAQFGERGLGTDDRREQRLHVTSVIVGRPVSSTNDLTHSEASGLIDVVGSAEDAGSLAALVRSVEAADAGTQP